MSMLEPVRQVFSSSSFSFSSLRLSSPLGCPLPFPPWFLQEITLRAGPNEQQRGAADSALDEASGDQGFTLALTPDNRGPASCLWAHVPH